MMQIQIIGKDDKLPMRRDRPLRCTAIDDAGRDCYGTLDAWPLEWDHWSGKIYQLTTRCKVCGDIVNVYMSDAPSSWAAAYRVQASATALLPCLVCQEYTIGRCPLCYEPLCTAYRAPTRCYHDHMQEVHYRGLKQIVGDRNDPPEEKLPTIEEMSGLIDDFTGGPSLEDYLKEIRNG